MSFTFTRESASRIALPWGFTAAQTIPRTAAAQLDAPKKHSLDFHKTHGPIIERGSFAEFRTHGLSPVRCRRRWNLTYLLAETQAADGSRPKGEVMAAFVEPNARTDMPFAEKPERL